jgi:hypothetical protein
MSGDGRPSRPVNRGAVAGGLLVASILLCGGAGFGLGAVVGAPVLLGLLGIFVGLAVGFVVVHSRFRDL